MKIIKYSLVILVAFVGGYYSALIVVDDKIATIKAIGDITTSKLNEFTARREADNLLHRLEVESGVLNQLVNIHENGKPINIAIKDSANALKKEINRSSELLNNTPEEQKPHITNKLNEIKNKNSDVLFHYGS